MWNLNRANRITGDREQVKEHLMHMQRLRNVKPCVDMKKPPKPTHVVKNYKKELKNMERMSEIQYQNRVLLRKMLQIDLKPTLGTKQKSVANLRPASAKSRKTQASRIDKPQGLNSYNSLNRANRIRGLANIIDENKLLLDKLQKTKSQYSAQEWSKDHQKTLIYKDRISKNGDRYCKNPYFLHSLCTQQPSVAYTDNGNSAIGSYQKITRKQRRRVTQSRGSGMYVGEDGQTLNPPRIRKKTRPFSAPRHQGLRSLGLKSKIQSNQQQMVAQRPGTQEQQYQGEFGGLNPQQMETVDEQNQQQQYFEEDMDQQIYDQNDQEYGQNVPLEDQQIEDDQEEEEEEGDVQDQQIDMNQIENNEYQDDEQLNE